MRTKSHASYGRHKALGSEHHCSIFNLYSGPGARLSDRDQVFTTREILNLHSNIQSRSVKHFFSVSTQKSCQFVFHCSAEFYFTQKIKCQSLPDSGIDTVYSALDTWDLARSILLPWSGLSHRPRVYFLAKEGSKVRLVLGFLHIQYGHTGPTRMIYCCQQ